MLIHEQNKAEIKYINLGAWSKYAGKGIVCREGESDSNHAGKVVATGTTFNEGLDADLIGCGLGMEDGELVGNLIDNLEYIKNNVHVLNLSVGGFFNEKVDALFKELVDAGVIVVTSAGNSDDDVGVDGYAKSKHTITIANGYLYKGKEVRRYRTSAIGDGIDFIMFGNWFVKYKDKWTQVNGTSFSSPFVAFVLIPRIQEFFIKKAGRRLNQHEMYQFLLDNCKYLGNVDEFGNGIIILNDPDDIDVEKYVSRKEIILKIDSPIIRVDGEDQLMDVAPLITSNRTFVPVRFVAETLGYKVDWDGINYKVTISNNNKVVELFVENHKFERDSKIMYVNGVTKEMDVAPFIIDERTFVPVRFVAEEFGCDVEWINETREVIIKGG